MIRSGSPSLWCRWFRFNAVGLVGIGVQWTLLATLLKWVQLDYLVATAIAVELTVLHNFAWHELWTWQERTGSALSVRLGRLIRFNFTTGLCSIAGNLIFMWILHGAVGLTLSVSTLLSLVACSACNFLLANLFVYRVSSSAAMWAKEDRAAS